MKAYVIKNKEGKYLTGFYLKDGESEPAFDTKDLTQALLYNEDNYVFYADLGEPIEITIAEGDLEKENKILEKALELACGVDGDIFRCPNICEIGDDTRCVDCRFNYYIQQAKEQRDED